jgi:hypothetical protein
MRTQVLTAGSSNATFTPNSGGDVEAQLTFLTGTDLKIAVGSDSTSETATISAGDQVQVITIGRDSSKQLNYSSAGGATLRVSW